MTQSVVKKDCFGTDFRINVLQYEINKTVFACFVRLF
jgi:hypothetical protein